MDFTTIGRAPYVGNSERTQRRKEHDAKAAVGSASIVTFFSEPPESPKKRQKLDQPESPKKTDLGESIQKIRFEIRHVGKSEQSNEGVLAYEHLRLSTLHQYFIALQGGRGKMETSLELAESVWGKGPYMATCIRQWADEFLQIGELSRHMQGRFSKPSLLQDEDVRIKCVEWLRAQKPEERGPKSLKAFVEKEILPGLQRESISEETCRKCLWDWNFRFAAHIKDVYFDGHEREDAIQYRGATAEGRGKKGCLSDT